MSALFVHPDAHMVSHPIRFFHQGQIQTIRGLPPTTTVLQWLREHAHCTGTKEGCAEGDCGACTAVVAELDSSTKVLTKHTVNACIQFLPTLNGKALLTVEDLKGNEAGSLHPCQQAMVDCHASQCGFCTPGFVMSLWQLYENHPAPLPRPDMADALAGNLCRCTGYRPILDAAEAMHAAPRVVFDEAPIKRALAFMEAEQSGVFCYEGPNTSDTARPDATQRFMIPTSLSALAALRSAWPQAHLLAGSTDMGLWVNKQFKALGDIIYVGRVAELQAVTQAPDGLTIGAGASLEDAWSALAHHVPALREVWKRFASPPVRHAGTMGGNIANGSPIGDSAPILLAMGASVVMQRGQTVRSLPLADFYVGYMRNALQSGEFLHSLNVPLLRADQGEVLRAYKISKRRDSDISTLCAGLMLRLEGHTIVEARLGWGGMAATARRAAHAEAALVGQPWTQSTLQAAQLALAQDFQPMTDLRATSHYRLKVAANLLTRFWFETRLNAPFQADQVQVWPANSHHGQA